MVTIIKFIFQWIIGIFTNLDEKTKRKIIDQLIELSVVILKSMWVQKQKSNEGK
ncbi:hypothetical protein ACP1HW_004566 [Klebsiella pneumoniae]|nr:hypothetical protein [Klebsiella pneumoniae]HBR4373044.1 hypothetical protein [Klebsiella pneumoniae]HCK6997433.1 hypothetical protein [Klebsiella pneumoniae]HCK7008743.1 hypothetical protein [Klebsiella pneumoniae]HDT4525455.1 hypothetical protein [Klebsiella pneumoniae subsp. pneumoniae]